MTPPVDFYYAMDLPPGALSRLNRFNLHSSLIHFSISEHHVCARNDLDV